MKIRDRDPSFKLVVLGMTLRAARFFEELRHRVIQRYPFHPTVPADGLVIGDFRSGLRHDDDDISGFYIINRRLFTPLIIASKRWVRCRLQSCRRIQPTLTSCKKHRTDGTLLADESDFRLYPSRFSGSGCPQHLFFTNISNYINVHSRCSPYA